MPVVAGGTEVGGAEAEERCDGAAELALPLHVGDAVLWAGASRARGADCDAAAAEEVLGVEGGSWAACVRRWKGVRHRGEKV